MDFAFPTMEKKKKKKEKKQQRETGVRFIGKFVTREGRRGLNGEKRGKVK